MGLETPPLLSALQIRILEKNTLNAKTQLFIAAKNQVVR